MSTKINVRSPFYLSYSEPTQPDPVFSASYANPTNFTVDESGGISLPDLDFGIIVGFSSSASDFSNSKFGEVSSDTSRTLTLTVQAPEGFSNVGSGIQIDVTATQPAKPASCGTVVTGGTMSSQTIAAGGASVTLSYNSTFGGTTSSFTDIVLNNQNQGLDFSLDTTAKQITITSKNTAGPFHVYIERIDQSTGCNAFVVIPVTVSAPTVAFDCTAANILGGNVAADGTLTTPTSTGTITATKETSGGASVTSVAANTSGSLISKTLFYDVTAPAGYSNTGATIECSFNYGQDSTTASRAFDCNDVDFDDQAILTDGSVTAGVAKWHQAPNGKADANYLLTITSFTPTKFDPVTSITNRDVDYTITVPPGFTNSGGSLTCTERVKQPAGLVVPTPTDPCSNHTNEWYIGVQSGFDFNLFTAKQHFAVTWAVFFDKSTFPDSSWQGTYMCSGGNRVTNVANGTHTFIRKFKDTTSTDNHEYVIVFGSGSTVKSVYLKDWTTKTIRRI